MKYDITVYDIANNEIRHDGVDCQLEEFQCGDWSCDCRRSTLFPGTDFFRCRMVRFIILLIRESGTGKIVGHPNMYNIGYNDASRAIAQKVYDSTLFVERGGSAELASGFLVPATTKWATSNNNGAKIAGIPILPILKTPPAPSKPPQPISTTDADKYIAGNELESAKKILVQWNPLDLNINVCESEYEVYAKKFVEWAPKCNTVRDLATQIAARFNHMTCLRLNDDGRFEIFKEQTITADVCFEIANRIRKVCGMLEKLSFPQVVSALPKATPDCSTTASSPTYWRF